MQPAEAGGVFAAENRLMGFAVVFEGPHGIPEVGAMGGHHATFTGGGEDLVLAEAPGSHIANATGPAVKATARCAIPDGPAEPPQRPGADRSAPNPGRHDSRDIPSSWL